MQTVNVLRQALLQLGYCSRNFGASPTVSAGNGTGADEDNRMQVDSLKKVKRKGKGKYQNQKGTRLSNTSNTDINTCENGSGTGRPVGEAHDNSNNNSDNNTKKGKNNKNGKGNGKQLDVVHTSPLCETASILSYPSHTLSTIEALWCNPDVQQKGWIMTLGGVTMNSQSSTRRQAGAE